MKTIVFLFLVSNGVLVLAQNQTKEAENKGEDWTSMNKIGRAAIESGNYQEALRLLGRGLELAKKEYGLKSKNYALTLGNLGYLQLYPHQR